MSSSGERTHLKLVTVGDFDPQADDAIEYDFIGREIAGRYTIRAQIGGGGMADVFRATDEQLGVDVAIKLLKPRLASDELRARMVQEARAAAQVRHDNLVRVSGTGKLDGTAYIVMELLAGPNLEAYAREYRGQRIPWREALDLLLPALDAVRAIHERGYVHRDIKAGNILVTREPGRPPTAVVIDLGLVKPDRTLRDAASPPTTEVGRLLCTPGYTSPEQAAGRPVDRRSDVYSMAVTLYRVLAGRLPFHAARGQPMAVVLAKHMYEPPTLLAEAGAGAAIPPVVAAVIEAALRKDPNERPQTMEAFAEALREAAASVREDRAGDRRRRLLAPLLALVVGAVIGGVAVSPRPASEAGAVQELVVRPRGEPVVIDLPGERWHAPLALDEPVIAEELWLPVIDRPLAEVEQKPPRVTPPGRRRELVEVARRLVARRHAAVQRCVDLNFGGSDRLAVAVTIETSGRVLAHAVGASESPLSRCLARAFVDTPVAAPREPVSFVHVFKLRPPPGPP